MADRFSRGQRMKKRWASLGTNTPTAFTAPSTAVFSGFIVPTEAQTVIRMLGEYLIVPAPTPSANDHASITVGIGIASADGVTAGSGPDPADEPEYPWLYWANHNFNFPVAAANDGLGGGVVRQTVDVRSMRKMKPREALFITAQYQDGSGTPALDMTAGFFRVLLAQ